MKQIRVILYLFVLSSFFGLCKRGFAAPLMPLDEVLPKMIRDYYSGQDISKFSLNAKHPDSIGVEVLKSLRDEKSGRFHQIINRLENVRERVLYSGLEKASNYDSRELLIGSYGSYRLWRELIYLLLGRSYYATESFDLAIKSFSGIPDDSPFYSIAILSLGWSYLELENVEQAEKVIEKFEGKEKHFVHEHLLQEAMLLLLKKEYQKSFYDIEQIYPRIEKSNVLKSVAFKIYAEAGYKYWLHERAKWSFSKSLSVLQSVIRASKDFSMKSCDTDCRFLLSETWWNIASLYRVEDPVKYVKDWKKALGFADEVLKNTVDQSIQRKKALVHEDAFFLSIATAWERQNYQDALERLMIFPRLYPQGRYREDVYQLLGDYFFEKGLFKKSVTYFRKLAEVGPVEKVTYGVYKSAWCFYNLGKKWKALRHLERIVKELNKDTSAMLTSLYKEVERDMLLFMAELQNSRSALKEIAYLGYKNNKRAIAIELLAETYQKIGKFTQSNNMYVHLIDSLIGKKIEGDGLKWLLAMVKNYLALAKRREIPTILQKYYVRTKKTGDTKKFSEEISKIILLVHREARKTDNADIWKATDELYLVVDSLLPKSNSFQFFYHGAQRFEQRGHPFKSIDWYQQAAIVGDENAREAAISGLRVLTDLAEGYELSVVKKIDSYDQVAKHAKWFVDYFYGQDEAILASRLFLNSLLQLGEDDFVATYLSDLAADPEREKAFKDLSARVFSYLYRLKEWERVYLLAVNVQKETQNDEYLKQLGITAQQAAFQMAYQTQQAKNFESAMEWYKKSLKQQVDAETMLKSWHNLIHSVEQGRSYHQLDVSYPKFHQFVQKEKFPLPNPLVEKTYLRFAKLMEQNKELVKSADILMDLMHLRKEYQFDLIFHTTEIYALARVHQKFNDAASLLREHHEARLKLDQKIILTKYFLHLGFYEETYHFIKSFSSKELSRADILILVRDLYFTLLSIDERKLLASFAQWILDQNKLRVQPVLGEVMGHLERKREYPESPLIEEFDADQKYTLEAMIPKIQEVFQTMKSASALWKPFVTDNLLVHQKVGVCNVAGSRKMSTDRIGALYRYAMVNQKGLGQWAQLGAKIQESLTKYQKLLAVEKKICTEKESEWKKFYQELDEGFCYFDRCMKHSKKYSEVGYPVESYNDAAKSILKGSTLAAENYAHLKTKGHHRSFLLALVRLAFNDRLNSFALLQSIPKKHQLSSAVRYILNHLDTQIDEPINEDKLLQLLLSSK